jgi:tRNA dimethylallyltransferase
MKSILLSINGPTGIGKTKLAISLAEHYKTEIISSDSRQFYKETSIGTAVPTEEELAKVQHHCVQHKSIHDSYTVGDFEKDVLKILGKLFNNHDLVILVGGSGLYTDAVIRGLDNFPEVDSQIRLNLNKQYDQKGIEPLSRQLISLDPLYAKSVDLKNPHRVIRALEICLGTGLPYSSFLNKKKTERPFLPIHIGLSVDRAILYDRINNRVNKMMQDGLLQEAQTLYPYRHLNALQTVGYSELFDYLDEKCDLDTAIEEIKKNTRRFAKRQLTWYRKNKNLLWFDMNYDLETIVKAIETQRTVFENGN